MHGFRLPLQYVSDDYGDDSIGDKSDDTDDKIILITII